MSIFEDIQRDHDRVRNMFDKLMKTSDSAIKTRERTYQSLHETLIAHMEAEEETIYPAIFDTKLKQLGLEAKEEHEAAKHIMSQLDGIAVDDEVWHPRFKVLMETVTHHMDEEEDNVLPKSKEIFDAEQVKSLTRAFKEAKKGVMAAA